VGNNKLVNNRHSTDWSVVKACLLAGLYPNVVRLDTTKKRTNMYDSSLGSVKVHPSSVLSKQINYVQFEQRWGMYSEKVRTVGGIFLYDFSQISPLAILLFSPQMKKIDSIHDILGFDHGDVDETESNSNNETLRLIKEIIRAKGGEIGLAKLSRLLNQAHPRFRSEMQCGIQQFLELHNFKVDKRSGARMVYSQEAGAYSNKEQSFPYFLSTCNWIYFGCKDLETIKLIQESKLILDRILESKVDLSNQRGMEIPEKAQQQFVDVLCLMLQKDSKYDDAKEAETTEFA